MFFLFVIFLLGAVNRIIFKMITKIFLNIKLCSGVMVLTAMWFTGLEETA
jgi:hypothetical protein